MEQKLDDLIFENYILPNKDFRSGIDNLNYEKISDSSIKSKLLKIDSSIKSFNIILKSNQNNISNTLIDNYLIGDNSKNYFINFLLDLIIDFIWKIKEENLERDLLIDKINNLNNLKNEMEKKIKKLNFELEEAKKDIKKIYNNNENFKEKIDKSQKNNNGELFNLKNDNKKLNLLIINFKNEIKKKEIDFLKLQEKHKKILGMGNTNNIKNCNFILENLIHDRENKNNFINSINEFNQNKFNLIVNQNLCLFYIIKKLQNFIDKICLKFNTFFEQKIEDPNKYFMDIINIKDGLFSLHLLDKNLLDNFSDLFLSNLEKFDDMIKLIIEIANNNFNNGKIKNKIINFENLNQGIKQIKNNKYNQIANLSNNKILTPINKQVEIKIEKLNSGNKINKIKNKNNSIQINENKSDILVNGNILKNFKKWSLNFPVNNLNKNMSSKWFDNIEQHKQINYEYDENTVIKSDSKFLGNINEDL